MIIEPKVATKLAKAIKEIDTAIFMSYDSKSEQVLSMRVSRKNLYSLLSESGYSLNTSYRAVKSKKTTR